jgi:hypothetical protein
VAFSRFLMPLAALALLTGCPGDDPPNPTADAGVVAGTDAGSNPADTGPPAPKTQEPTRALTTGGGTGSNAAYKVRLIIGGPTGNGAGSNATNKVNLGAGAAQHGQ